MEPDEDVLARHTTAVALRNGTRIRLRPVLPTDKAEVLDGFRRLSPESRYRRFMSPLHDLTPEMLAALTEIDYVDHFALGAETLDEPPLGIGVARYVRLTEDPEIAEAAVAVVDDWHGLGVGTVLLQSLGAVAVENGVKRFRGYVMAENRPVIELLEHLGASIERDDIGLLRCEIELPEPATLKESLLYRVLRAVARGELGFRGPLAHVLQRHPPAGGD